MSDSVYGSTDSSVSGLTRKTRTHHLLQMKADGERWAMLTAYDYSSADGTPHRCFLKKPQACDPASKYEMYVDLGAYGIPRAVLESAPSTSSTSRVKSRHGSSRCTASICSTPTAT